MIEKICETEQCAGCAACAASCPVGAIRMVQDEEGFWKPEINEKKCIECKKCQHICPNNHHNFTNTPQPECYAVMATNTVRCDSSSGGFASILAEWIIEKEGIVVGAAFDELMQVRHIAVEDVAGIAALKGSKYVQSRMDPAIFRTVKLALEKGRWVFFSGTPCQIAGLKNHLERDWEKLVTSDLICHGTPSQRLFDNFLHGDLADCSVRGFRFRGKGTGQEQHTNTIYTEQGEIKLSLHQSAFSRAFFLNVGLRNCCYACPYARIPRVGDFTMGDFWGYNGKEVKDLGVSLVLLNNAKAQNLWKKLSPRFAHVVKQPLQTSLRWQPHTRQSCPYHPARRDFYHILLERGNVAQTVNEVVEKSVGILNFHWENTRFGTVLTAYALNQYLNNHGYYARNINYRPAFSLDSSKQGNPHFENFRRKHLPMTGICENWSDLRELNEEFPTFIVGGDQVWRHDFIKDEKESYFLYFAETGKKIISYAASFGTECLSVSKEEKKNYSSLLSLFDHISVREKSGVSICESLGVKASQVVDPVFLLTCQEWEDLVKEEPYITDRDEVVVYTLNESLGTDIFHFIEHFQSPLIPQKVTNITSEISISNWLAKIRNCKFFLTDSFYGVCFAILFRKQFLCVSPNTTISTQVFSLLNCLEIQGRLHLSLEDLPFSDILAHPINYDKVQQLLTPMIAASSRFLLSVLQKGEINEKRKKALLYARARQQIGKMFVGYQVYRILSILSFGKQRKKYREKRKKFRREYADMKKIIKSHSYIKDKQK